VTFCCATVGKEPTNQVSGSDLTTLSDLALFTARVAPHRGRRRRSITTTPKIQLTIRPGDRIAYTVCLLELQLTMMLSIDVHVLDAGSNPVM
jgi:hypothetical protein